MKGLGGSEPIGNLHDSAIQAYGVSEVAIHDSPRVVAHGLRITWETGGRIMILRQFTWPGDLTMTLIGGKWKPLIIYHLLRAGNRRFNELKNTMPGISAKMLAKHLRELELDGLVHRQTGEGRSGKITYAPTDRSRNLAPVLDSMYQWARQNGSAYGDPSDSHAYPGFEPGAAALFVRPEDKETRSSEARLPVDNLQR